MPVATLRSSINAAHAVLIASPEYAHGVTGALKNALDWMVGNESLVHKLVAIFNASPRATHAQQALREILMTMSARLVERTCISVAILGTGLDEDGVVAHPTIRVALAEALHCLQVAVTSSRDAQH